VFYYVLLRLLVFPSAISFVYCQFIIYYFFVFVFFYTMAIVPMEEARLDVAFEAKVYGTFY
jgi:hypothetical protein